MRLWGFRQNGPLIPSRRENFRLRNHPVTTPEPSSNHHRTLQSDTKRSLIENLLPSTRKHLSSMLCGSISAKNTSQCVHFYRTTSLIDGTWIRTASLVGLVYSKSAGSAIRSHPNPTITQCTAATPFASFDHRNVR